MQRFILVLVFKFLGDFVLLYIQKVVFMPLHFEKFKLVWTALEALYIREDCGFLVSRLSCSLTHTILVISNIMTSLKYLYAPLPHVSTLKIFLNLSSSSKSTMAKNFIILVLHSCKLIPVGKSNHNIYKSNTSSGYSMNMGWHLDKE